jgi:hypothetical protein
MLSRRWRARLGLFAAFSLGSLSIGSLAVRSAEHRRLLRAYFAGRAAGQGGAPAQAANSASPLPSVGTSVDGMSPVAQSLPRPSAPR